MKEQKFIKSTYTLERNETLFSESHTESKKKGGKKNTSRNCELLLKYHNQKQEQDSCIESLFSHVHFFFMSLMECASIAKVFDDTIFSLWHSSSQCFSVCRSEG